MMVNKVYKEDELRETLTAAIDVLRIVALDADAELNGEAAIALKGLYWSGITKKLGIPIFELSADYTVLLRRLLDNGLEAETALRLCGISR